MFYRLLAILFGVTALSAVAAGTYVYFSPPHEGPGLIVEQPEQVLQDPVVGRDYEIDFRVVNQTGQVHRVVGGGNFCIDNCCLSVKLSEPVSVPARGSVMIPVHITINKAGPLKNSVGLFLDDGSLRDVRLTVTGTAVDAPPPGQ